MPVVDFTKTQAAAVPAVDEAKCRACRKCLARTACKSKAILQIDPEEPPFVDASLCYGCHACIPACPAEAIYLPSREPRSR